MNVFDRILNKRNLYTDDNFENEENMTNKEKFDRAMSFARKVNQYYINSLDYIDEGEQPSVNPLKDVIKAIGRAKQDEYIRELIYSVDEIEREPMTPDNCLYNLSIEITDDGLTFRDLMIKIDENIEVDLSKNLILPSPWKKDRLARAISTIGNGKIDGEWEYIPTNHVSIMWLPLEIVWVSGGNHSIATGIIQGEGRLKTKTVYDISKVYEYIYCDGIGYRRKDTKKIISYVKDIEFAIIFEIGRLLIDNT